MPSENQQVLRLQLVEFMRRLFFVALTAGLLSPTVAIADTYDALCNNNDCQITINESGVEGPQGFIAKDNIIQWHSYKIALGTAGVINGGNAGLAAATAACFTGVFCPVAVAVGVAGGNKAGSILGKGNKYFLTVMGQKDDGSNYVQSFTFPNKNITKKFQKEIIKLTGLRMGQVKSS